MFLCFDFSAKSLTLHHKYEKMNNTAAIARLLKKPDLPILLKEVEAALHEEKKHRHAFREWLDEDKKAEFINGEVVMHSPVKRMHLKASKNLSVLLSFYVQAKLLGEVMVEKALIALERNDYEPDICFFSKERAAGFSDDQMIFPAPDMVVEILSKSTAKYDRGIKKVDYAAHGVREYWIIDPERQEVEQYTLLGKDTAYMPPYLYRIDDDIRSHVVEGFDIPVAAIFQEARCLQMLRDWAK